MLTIGNPSRRFTALSLRSAHAFARCFRFSDTMMSARPAVAQAAWRASSVSAAGMTPSWTYSPASRATSASSASSVSSWSSSDRSLDRARFCRRAEFFLGQGRGSRVQYSERYLLEQHADGLAAQDVAWLVVVVEPKDRSLNVEQRPVFHQVSIADPGLLSIGRRADTART